MAEYTDRLEFPIPDLGATEWRGLYVEAWEIVDEALGRILQAGGLTFVRRYDGGWPERGEVPDGSSVMWVKVAPTDPDPPVGGTGLQTSFDLLVIAEN